MLNFLLHSDWVVLYESTGFQMDFLAKSSELDCLFSLLPIPIAPAPFPRGWIASLAEFTQRGNGGCLQIKLEKKVPVH